MLTNHWPLSSLRLRTPRLELRLPDHEELAELGELAAQGVHDPSVMPFTVPWTDLPPAERARSVMQFTWRTLGDLTPEKWQLPFAVFHEGRVVGLQEISAEHLSVTREVDTGSWLGRDHQGKGLGTEMRAAVLHLGFTGLGADFATSGAFSDNHASQAVSRKLGYEPDGITRLAVRGEPVTCHRLRLTRTRWQQTPHPATTIEGLEPCLPLLGAPGPTASCGA
ncbi:GNAT family N-acetyltransferase [Streptacidiphilus sp. N1-10]|uniref:GNAT family N-acetyltransferase n=1 Tax=Streptacidiphilus jeojiensis TaxID=3229225 RepID=A0ABV6XQF1_9ACTN